MYIYMFPGQGSQFLGMGEALWGRYPELVAKANDILGYDLVKLCLEGPQGRLDMTAQTQPAIFVNSYLAYLAEVQDNPGREVVAYLGHSLGEYTALCAAGYIDFSECLKLVKARGDICQRASEGRMSAVIGLNIARVEGVIADSSYDDLYIANHNTHKQIVIAGSPDGLVGIVASLQDAGARRVVGLAVSAAFHTPFMATAMDEYRDELVRVSWNSNPRGRVVANRTADYYVHGDLEVNLARHLCEPVRWLDSVEFLLREYPAAEFIELGPGRVLQGMLAKIKLGK